MQQGTKDRNYEIYRLREQGLTFTEIGKQYGLCSDRVSTIYRKEVRLERLRKNDELWQFICGTEETDLQVRIYNSLCRRGIHTREELQRHISGIVNGTIRIRGIDIRGKEFLQSLQSKL